MKEFFAVIGALMGMILIYNYVYCEDCWKKSIPPLQNEYTRGVAKDFCAIDNINLYFHSQDECCKYKMACGDDKKPSWNSKEEKCVCK